MRQISPRVSRLVGIDGVNSILILLTLCEPLVSTRDHCLAGLKFISAVARDTKLLREDPRIKERLVLLRGVVQDQSGRAGREGDLARETFNALTVLYRHI